MKKNTLITTILLILMLTTANLINAQSWTQRGSDIDGETAYDRSGRSVSLSSDGSIVAIGAKDNDENGDHAGHVRIYEYNGGIWTQIGNDIDGEASGDCSGQSVSLSSDGSIVAIGAPYNGSWSGHVRIYEYNEGIWTQMGSDIDGEAAGDCSGWSVSLSSDGSIVAIGAPYNVSWSGHVRIYEYNGGIWTQMGSDIDGEAAEDCSGWSVSLSFTGSIVAIGAPAPGSTGHVRIYEYIGGIWTQMGSDIDIETANADSSGSVSLSSDGLIVAIGTPTGNDNWSGHVKIYEYNGGVWTQMGSDIDGEAAEDCSGWSVSLSSTGSIVAIGAPSNEGNGAEAGHVRIYEYNGGVWIQMGSDIDGEAAYDEAGRSVNLSSEGSIVAIGAPGNDGNNAEAGQVRVFDICGTSGSVTEVVCDGDSYTSPSGNYIWTSSGTYYDTIPNAAGCDSIITVILDFKLPYQEQICLVTVDSATNKNMIIYEKTPDKGTVSYNIYKEVSINIYNWLGNSSFDSLGVFIDDSSNPAAHADKYKISVVDTCGNESEKSFYHKTINLMVGQGVPQTTVILDWDEYEEESGSFVPGKYYIYRGLTPDELELYDSISASFTSYNDVDVTTTYYYAIGITKDEPCIVTKGGKAVYGQSLSNIIEYITEGIDDINSYFKLSIYPNPFNNSTTVKFDNPRHDVYKLIITDISGRIVRVVNNITDNKIEIERGDMKSGFYMMELTCLHCISAGKGGRKVFRGKIIIE